MEVPGKRRRARPKRWWLDNIKNDLSERELSGEDPQYRAKWRRLIRHIDPTEKWEKMRKKKRWSFQSPRSPVLCFFSLYSCLLRVFLNPLFLPSLDLCQTNLCFEFTVGAHATFAAYYVAHTVDNY